VKRLVGFYQVRGLDDFIKWKSLRKTQKERLRAQQTLLELNSLTVTVHGRTMLIKVCEDPDNGLPDEIRQMYLTLVKHAPIRYFAQWN
jgi:hypothetical protein